MLTLAHAAHATGFVERRGSVRVSTLPKELPQEVESWRVQAHLTDDARLARRLHADDLDFDEVCGYFAGLVPHLDQAPPWLAFLERVGTRSTPIATIQEQDFPFASALFPFVEEALDRVAQRLERRNSHPRVDCHSVFGPAARSTLGRRLFHQAARVFVWEMHLARERGELHGATPAERYESFVEQLVAGGLEKTLAAYPVLARLLSTITAYWVEAAIELAERLEQDAQVLSSWCDCPVNLETLRLAEWGLGDPHRRGRTVWRLHFDGCSLIYKPRSLAIEAAFQRLLAWINLQGASLQMRLLGVQDRGSHGWVEFVSARSCTSPEEVDRYYHRLGAYICLTHLLDGTDFHSTNLLAVGEHPILIDLEGLFHPRLHQQEARTPDDAALKLISESPLRTGLLPTRLWETGESAGLDISGVGADPDQPIRRRVWEQMFTDGMRLGMEIQRMGSQPSHVLLAGERISPAGYTDPIVQGFLETWDLVMRHRAEFLAADGPIRHFVGCQTRLIFHNTSTYQVLQDAALHPDFLRTGIQRDVALDRLWITAPADSRYDALLAYERNELWLGDVPCFSVAVDAQDVLTNHGVISGLLERSSLAVVQARVAEMTDQLAKRHAALIRASLATINSRLPNPVNPFPVSPAGKTLDWVDAARAVGQELLDTSIHCRSGTTWIGLVLAREQWRVAPLPPTLYDGLSGIGFFFAYLAHLTGEQHFSEVCDAIINTLRMQIDLAKTAPTGIGAFTGWASILYLCTHLNTLRNENSTSDLIERCVQQIEQGIETDQAFDWMDGSAGCAAVLLGAYKQSHDERLLDLAVRCGKHLLGAARAVKGGLGWLRSIHATPLAGLAHGASGIALALARLANTTGNDEFRRAAQGALHYERSVYDEAAQNWPDLRGSTTPAHFMCAWCHGAAGIGMARLELASVDVRGRDEAEIALDTVRDHGFGRTLCQCHGDLGNLDLLLQAGYIDEARQIAVALLGGQLSASWKGATFLQAATPGLMLGMAGIGFELLRLAAPTEVPSPLILA